MRKHRFLYFTVILGFVALLAGNVAVAHMGATGTVKQRMDLMEAIGKSMKEIGAMVRGRVAVDSSRAAAAAQEIAAHGRHMPKLFPPESNRAPSEARPIIWQQRAEFNASAAAMVNAAEALAVAASTADRGALKSAYRALGKTCKDCHRVYRAKKKK